MGKIIDISHHQGTINFDKLKANADLAIIRVQYGSSAIDTRYKEYVAGCKRVGIPFGHYAYARFVSVNDAKVEAQDFLDRADADAKFLVVDVEELTCSSSVVVQATQAFIDVCRAAGKRIGLYTGHSFYSTYGMKNVNADFLWIPRYSSNDTGALHTVKPSMPCHLWQYSQNGRIDGIVGAVDLNTLNGVYGLDWFTGSINQPTSGDDTVRSIQRTLNSRYETELVVDGIYGTLSERALILGLQKELNRQFNAGIVEDGIYGAATENAVPNVREGATGNITWIIQAALYCEGFSAGTIDSVFDSETTAAVKRFQAAKGLYADGIVGKGTFNALF